MHRSEGIRLPGSNEDILFHIFYRIPCVAFSPFSWECGLVYYYLLGNCGATAFLHLCQLSYAWTISRQILQRISSDRYHSSLILSRVCLLGQPHVSAFNTLCLLWCPTFGKTNIFIIFFSVHAFCSPLWKPISISIAHKMNLSTEVCENWSAQNRVNSQRTDFDFHFP